VANDDIVMFKKTPIKREDGTEIDADEIGELMLHHDVIIQYYTIVLISLYFCTV